MPKHDIYLGKFPLPDRLINQYNRRMGENAMDYDVYLHEGQLILVADYGDAPDDPRLNRGIPKSMRTSVMDFYRLSMIPDHYKLVLYLQDSEVSQEDFIQLLRQASSQHPQRMQSIRKLSQILATHPSQLSERPTRENRNYATRMSRKLARIRETIASLAKR